MKMNGFSAWISQNKMLNSNTQMPYHYYKMKDENDYNAYVLYMYVEWTTNDTKAILYFSHTHWAIQFEYKYKHRYTRTIPASSIWYHGQKQHQQYFNAIAANEDGTHREGEQTRVLVNVFIRVWNKCCRLHCVYYTILRKQYKRITVLILPPSRYLAKDENERIRIHIHNFYRQSEIEFKFWYGVGRASCGVHWYIYLA